MSVAPKRPKGPPLNAMRAFEAAARHISFVAAAEELNVTAGAISQHIKTLEGWAGMPLFRRNAQGVELTREGQALLADFTKAFDALADATRALRDLKPNADFQIAALPSIAQLWLPKRLGKIRECYPQINFSVTAMETPPSLSRELFDLSIFFSVPDGSPNQICICQDKIIPVCAPSLLNRKQGDQGFEGISFLRDQTWANDWPMWSQNSGVQIRNSENGPQFSLYSLAVEEAKAGAGVLMGHLCLIEDALTAGALTVMHDVSCSTGNSLVIQVPRMPRQRSETKRIVQLLAN
ncbi:LysR family transcriptional regulator [Ruegeria sp. 2012CJ41-6]|uniref:LysR family transcriptional regulator n=1 Tax=Ruegeria spongiae TaxID=2942209 RepID=A0ABT0Q1E8_9RHOB|nr:LysR family transcriptional regulator [Ruegeria spongiae]MCL6283641.1 LysR family transcriptional regulator [Ruegeria spongiae]